MNDFKQYMENSKLLEIAEKVWPIFNEMQVNEDKTIGITEFEISINNKNKDHFNITKIDNNGKANFYTDKRLSVIDIKVSNAANLTHELSHVVYKYTENQRGNYGILAEYIHKILNDDKKSVIEYLKRDNISNYDKLIGYLCLADDDELTAKLAGFYIPHLLKGSELNEGDYYPSLKSIYNDMKTYKFSLTEIEEIIENDNEKQIISNYLGNISKNSETIRSLIKEINVQGAKFVSIYEGLLNE